MAGGRGGSSEPPFTTAIVYKDVTLRRIAPPPPRQPSAASGNAAAAVSVPRGARRASSPHCLGGSCHWSYVTGRALLLCVCVQPPPSELLRWHFQPNRGPSVAPPGARSLMWPRSPGARWPQSAAAAPAAVWVVKAQRPQEDKCPGRHVCREDVTASQRRRRKSAKLQACMLTITFCFLWAVIVLTGSSVWVKCAFLKKRSGTEPLYPQVPSRRKVTVGWKVFKLLSYTLYYVSLEFIVQSELPNSNQETLYVSLKSCNSCLCKGNIQTVVNWKADRIGLYIRCKEINFHPPQRTLLKPILFLY